MWVRVYGIVPIREALQQRADGFDYALPGRDDLQLQAVVVGHGGVGAEAAAHSDLTKALTLGECLTIRIMRIV